MPSNLNREALEAFINGQNSFFALSKRSLEESRSHFERAVRLDPGNARALAELSYVNTHIAIDNWHGPEEAREALGKAEAYARLAVAADPDDYDTHWALGYYLVNSGKPGDHAKGLKEFETARELFDNWTDRLTRKPDLLAEMGEVLVYAGEVKKGIEMIEGAVTRVPDWYRWNLAFAYYCNKQYDNAIAELDRMYRKPGDPRFLYDSLLTRSAAEAQKGSPKRARSLIQQFLELKEANRSGPAAKGKGKGKAKSGKAAKARTTKAKQDKGGPAWTIAEELRRMPFKNDKRGRALRDHWIEGLRKAGLPE